MLTAEIWAVVARELRGDPASLRACALVSSSMSSSMQSELFRSIKLGSGPRAHLTALLDSDHAALVSRYTRRLEVHGARGWRALAQLADPHGPQRWCGAFLNIQELELVDSELHLSDIAGEEDDVTLAGSLSASFPALQSLEIRRCTFPAPRHVFELLEASRGLRTLSFVEVSTRTPEAAQATDARTPPSTPRAFFFDSGALTLDAVRPLVATLADRIAWGAVERLGGSADVLQKFLMRADWAGAALKHLCVVGISEDCGHFGMNMHEWSDRGYALLEHLQTLVLALDGSCSRRAAIAHAVEHTLSRMTSRTIRDVALVLDRPKANWACTFDWEAVCNGMTYLDLKEPGLRRVLRVLVVGIVKGKEVERVEAAVRECLRRAEKFVRVEVRCGDREEMRRDGSVPDFPMVLRG